MNISYEKSSWIRSHVIFSPVLDEMSTQNYAPVMGKNVWEN